MERIRFVEKLPRSFSGQGAVIISDWHMSIVSALRSDEGLAVRKMPELLHFLLSCSGN